MQSCIREKEYKSAHNCKELSSSHVPDTTPADKIEFSPLESGRKGARPTTK